MIVYSFLFFLVFFTLIGVASSFKAKKNNSDYLLAGNSIPPWLAALSAIATNNSGYMFIGMIGFTYTAGLQAIWLMVGWITGDFLMSVFVHKRLRAASEKHNLLSFGGVVSGWHGTNYKKLRFLAGVITILFLGVYAAAQFKAGSKALHVLFGWEYSTGAIIGAVIVFAYCLSGGIRASIWTDAAQSVVMFFAMGALFFVGVDSVGGFSQYIGSLDSVSSTYLSVAPTGLAFDNFTGAVLFVIGWVFAGFGVIGQPHIMVRFMTLDNVENMNKTRAYYYAWYVAFYALTIGVGLTARLMIPDASNFDAELALPLMSKRMLPEILIGVVLAGIFSATMSTADSQVLSCSASFTRDLFPKRSENVYLTKLATAVVTLIALGVALYGADSVFTLVLISWSILSAAFGPILFLYAIGKRVNEPTGITMVLTGIGGTMMWRLLDLGNVMYEVGPGIMAGLMTYGLLTATGVNQINSSADAGGEKAKEDEDGLKIVTE